MILINAGISVRLLSLSTRLYSLCSKLLVENEVYVSMASVILMGSFNVEIHKLYA